MRRTHENYSGKYKNNGMCMRLLNVEKKPLYKSKIMTTIQCSYFHEYVCITVQYARTALIFFIERKNRRKIVK